ncbi:MAG: hypothetical protein JOY61_10215 [Chloroflexi bacterium]|nr:hypothetical protein [Chloroflexota bacterium]
MKSIVGHFDRPEQSGRLDSAIEITQLCARTGLEQVNSYQGERAFMMSTIDANVGTVKIRISPSRF